MPAWILALYCADAIDPPSVRPGVTGTKDKPRPTPRMLGWREWIRFPELPLPPIKAKVDTGARTSCLHAFEVVRFDRDGRDWLRFRIHPDQRDRSRIAVCEAPALDRRQVTDSGGHREMRWVIEAFVELADQRHRIELTLTDRDTMRFRMLLGRSAMKGRFTVDPSRSYLCGKPSAGPDDREVEP